MSTLKLPGSPPVDKQGAHTGKIAHSQQADHRPILKSGLQHDTHLIGAPSNVTGA